MSFPLKLRGIMHAAPGEIESGLLGLPGHLPFNKEHIAVKGHYWYLNTVKPFLQGYQVLRLTEELKQLYASSASLSKADMSS